MWPVRRILRLLWWFLCALTFVALPLTIWEFQKQQYDIHYQSWFIGGIFVILSMPISIYEIALHTEYYTRPRLQKHVIRILWMVPIYALDAWFALRFRAAREYLDPLRECYEAFVIYSFLSYLITFLEDELGPEGGVQGHLACKPPMKHVWPLSMVMKPWDMGNKFLWECRKGVLNYVVLRPLCTTIALITDAFDKYGEGNFDPHKSYMYLTAATNFSQLWALYCLVQLYTNTKEELAPIRPLSKFICIKAVVFVTFWQSVTIAILVSAGIIRKEDWTTVDKLNIASGIQDFLICIEMFVAALAHAYAFPPRDYMDPSRATKGFFYNVRAMFDLRDVVMDVGTLVEDHMSSATRTVVEAPQKAVRKAAASMARGTRKLFSAGTKSPSGRSDDFEDLDDDDVRCSLLTSPVALPAALPHAGPGYDTPLSELARGSTAEGYVSELQGLLHAGAVAGNSGLLHLPAEAMRDASRGVAGRATAESHGKDASGGQVWPALSGWDSHGLAGSLIMNNAGPEAGAALGSHSSFGWHEILSDPLHSKASGGQHAFMGASVLDSTALRAPLQQSPPMLRSGATHGSGGGAQTGTSRQSSPHAPRFSNQSISSSLAGYGHFQAAVSTSGMTHGSHSAGPSRTLSSNPASGEDVQGSIAAAQHSMHASTSGIGATSSRLAHAGSAVAASTALLEALHGPGSSPEPPYMHASDGEAMPTSMEPSTMIAVQTAQASSQGFSSQGSSSHGGSAYVREHPPSDSVPGSSAQVPGMLAAGMGSGVQGVGGNAVAGSGSRRPLSGRLRSGVTSTTGSTIGVSGGVEGGMGSGDVATGTADGIRYERMSPLPPPGKHD